MSRNKAERKYNPAEHDAAFELLPINRRRCIAFIPDRPNGSYCHCNRTKDEHLHTDNLDRSYEKWNQNIHTEKDFTREQAISLVNGAPYVRCDMNTDPLVVGRILLDIWGLPRPKLLMQVTGGHKYFKLRGKMEVSFLDDIITFASKSGTWLLTSGVNVGIVQLIGQSIRKRQLTKPHDRNIAIAVCNYGCVKNIDDFQRPEHRLSSRRSSTESIDENIENVNHCRTGEQSLEMNHTNFIFLDDGTFRRYNIGDYRTQLVKSIASVCATQNLSVPSVTLLFEGGEHSVRSIYNDLRQNIPVVIINNTGRVADYLVRWLSRTQEMDLDVNWTVPVEIDDENDLRISLNDTFKRRESLNIIKFGSPKSDDRLSRYRLCAKFEKYLNSLNEELAQAINGNGSQKLRRSDNLKTVNSEILLMVLYCLQPTVRSNLNVFNFNKGEKISETILRSICKCKMKEQSTKTVDQLDYFLELAIDWDCMNTAKEWIVQDSLKNIFDKKAIFCRALTKQRHKFVHYFIQLGLQVDEVFFHPKLNPFAARTYDKNNKRYKEFIAILYTEEAINRDDWLLQEVVETTNDQNRQVITCTDDLNALFRSLVGGYMKPLYYDSQIEEQENRMGVKRFTNSIFPTDDLEQKGQLIASAPVYKQLAKDYIMRDLFLWSIAMNYMKLARVFLAHMKDRICAALIATEILSHLRDTSSDAVYGDKKVDLTHWINYFEQYAINCMDLCFRNDPNMAQVLTIQRVEMFGDVTCLQVSDDAMSKRFASHPCCRQAENSIWYDKLHSDQYHIRYYIGQLVGTWTLGLLAPFTARFRTGTQNPLPTEPTLQSFGINYCDPYANNRFHQGLRRSLYQIWQFHQSPHIKFTYHHVQYIAFLFLFSYVLLFHFDPITPSHSTFHPTEILVIIIVSCMLLEEVRVFFSQDSLSFGGKCHSYFRSFFKQLCAISFLLFFVGLCLRCQRMENSGAFQAARIVMGYDLWFWWMRSLSFIIVNPFLGPHLVSIGKMLKNLSFFAILIAIVMTAYAVASRSMAFYGTFGCTGRNVLRYVLYPVYYLLYTNLSGELNGLDESALDDASIATHVLLAFHMLLINILLVNLLIAMFNKSFQDVQSVQTDIWNFQQYAVTREYYDRPALFIPFSTIFDLIALVQMSYQWYLRVRYNYANPFQRVFKVIAVQPELELIWQEFESASTYAYAEREALTKIDRTVVESEGPFRESTSSSTKWNDAVELSITQARKEKDTLVKLRNEFKAAIKELRSDMRLFTTQK